MGPKVKAAGVLLFMYGLGILSGIGWEAYQAHHRTQMFLADRRIQRLKQELNLSPWQEQVLREIAQDANERAQDANDAVNFDLAQIHEDSLEAIQELLTPQQRQQFDTMHRKYHARHHAGDNSRDSADPKNNESPGVSTTS